MISQFLIFPPIFMSVIWRFYEMKQVFGIFGKILANCHKRSSTVKNLMQDNNFLRDLSKLFVALVSIKIFSFGTPIFMRLSLCHSASVIFFNDLSNAVSGDFLFTPPEIRI